MLIFTHPACLQHDPGPGHAESPARLQAVLAALDDPRLAAIERVEAPRTSREQLLRVHTPAHIDAILDGTPREGLRQLDEDTLMSAHSAEAARRAAGAAVAAVDSVIGGDALRAFCAVRPPGHHALADHAMGFCLFNNVAVAAAHALAEHGLERVAIIDFDVHHGNGTQAIFAHETRVQYLSSHQMPLYPGTGATDEHGVGNIFNAPLCPGAGSAEFRQAWDQQLLPQLFAFAPQLVLISTGFDAHQRDPLANLNVEAADFAWLTSRLVEIAKAHAQGRIVSSLEGGYDLPALGECVGAHVAALMD